MAKYKVHTRWIGYSAIVVEANSPEEAENKMWRGEYHGCDAEHTGFGLDYGYDREQTIEIEELENENNTA